MNLFIRSRCSIFRLQTRNTHKHISRVSVWLHTAIYHTFAVLLTSLVHTTPQKSGPLTFSVRWNEEKKRALARRTHANTKRSKEGNEDENRTEKYSIDLFVMKQSISTCTAMRERETERASKRVRKVKKKKKRNNINVVKM